MDGGKERERDGHREREWEGERVVGRGWEGGIEIERWTEEGRKSGKEREGGSILLGLGFLCVGCWVLAEALSKIGRAHV